MNRRPRRRVSTDWITDLKAGKLPPRGGPAWDDYIGWRYFLDDVPGLPDARSAEGHALAKRAQPNTETAT